METTSTTTTLDSTPDLLRTLADFGYHATAAADAMQGISESIDDAQMKAFWHRTASVLRDVSLGVRQSESMLPPELRKLLKRGA